VLESTYRLRAFDLWRLMRIIHIDHKGKDESAPFVHSWMLRDVKRKGIETIYTSMPSSGVMVRVKLRRSAGSGKLVTIVEGRSSSVRSYGEIYQQRRKPPKDETMHTFLHSDLGGAGLWLPLCRRLLVLLHAPNLIRTSAPCNI
jgi:hypothetical protein